MPAPPDEARRGLNQQAVEGNRLEHRTDRTDYPTRRKVLSMVTGGIAATATVGTATATDRPTVMASPTCNGLQLEYTPNGPPLSFSVGRVNRNEMSPQWMGSKEDTLDPGETKEVPVPEGEYIVTTRPQGSRGWGAIPVEGVPVQCEPCSTGPEITATWSCSGGTAEVTLSNGNDSCIPVNIIIHNEDKGASNQVLPLHPDSDVNPTVYLQLEKDERWDFWAYDPAEATDCYDITGDTIPINGEPSPLQFEGDDCASYAKIEQA